MTDQTRLVAHLEEYRNQLRGHLHSLQDRHAHLETAWARLREIYLGQGAEMFAQAFGAASDRLREYAVEGEKVSRILEGKIEKLRIADSPNPEL